MKSNTANVYIKAKDETKEGINKALKSIDGLASGVAKLAKGFVAFQVIDAALGAIANSIGRVVEKMSALNDFENFGIPVDKAYELTEALSLAGLSSDQVLKSIGDLNAKLQEAPDNPALLKTLKEIGLSLNDIKSGDVSANYEKILDYLSKVENKEKAIAQAREIFGKQAVDLVDGAGEERFARIRDRIKESAEEIRASSVLTDEYKKNVQELSQIFEMELASAINGPLLVINAFLETLIQMSDEGKKAKENISIEDKMQPWKDFALVLADIINIVGNLINYFSNMFSIIYDGFVLGTKVITVMGDAVVNVLGAAISDATGKFGKLFDAFYKYNTFDFSGAAKSLEGIFDNDDKTGAAIDKTKKQISSLVAFSVESQKKMKQSIDNIGSYTPVIDIKKLETNLNNLGKKLGEKKSFSAPGGQNRTGKGSAAESADQMLNDALKKIEQAYAYEKMYTENSMKLNELLYANNKKGMQDFYSTKQTLAKKDYDIQMSIINAQLEATRKSMGSAVNQKEKTKIQEKENDLLIKKSKLELDYGILVQTNDFARTKAQDDYNDKLDEMRAKLKEINGDYAGANALRFGVEARNSAKGLDDESRRVNANLMAQNKILTDLQDKSRTLSDMTNTRVLQEEKLSLLGRNALIDNQKVVELRKEELAVMEEQFAALQQMALANPDNVGLQQALLQAEVDLIKFKQNVDPIAKQINDVLSSSIENAMGDLINGTKSFKDAFLSVMKSIEQEITRFVAKSLTQELMGGMNSLMGNTGQGSGGGSGGVGGFFSSLLGSMFGGARATGGPVEGGKVHLVGEKGPELLYTGSSGYVTSARDSQKAMGGGNQVVVNIYAQDVQSFRNSEKQVALQMQNALYAGNRNR